MDFAFAFIQYEHGLDTEDSYPYEARGPKEGTSCRFNKNNIGATDAGFVDIPSGDEGALKAAIATVGPVSVAIDASKLQFYDGTQNEGNG